MKKSDRIPQRSGSEPKHGWMRGSKIIGNRGKK